MFMSTLVYYIMCQQCDDRPVHFPRTRANIAWRELKTKAQQFGGISCLLRQPVLWLLADRYCIGSVLGYQLIPEVQVLVLVSGLKYLD